MGLVVWLWRCSVVEAGAGVAKVARLTCLLLGPRLVRRGDSDSLPRPGTQRRGLDSEHGREGVRRLICLLVLPSLHFGLSCSGPVGERNETERDGTETVSGSRRDETD